VSITLEDWNKTTFISPWGTFIYVVVPFGLCNALDYFQIVMTYVFFELVHKPIVVFIDDFINEHQTSQEEHLKVLKACFQKCREVGISLNPKKVYFGSGLRHYFGLCCFEKGKESNVDKVEVIVNLQPPTTIKRS
jgi:hypothetical protein